MCGTIGVLPVGPEPLMFPTGVLEPGLDEMACQHLFILLPVCQQVRITVRVLPRPAQGLTGFHVRQQPCAEVRHHGGETRVFTRDPRGHGTHASDQVHGQVPDPIELGPYQVFPLCVVSPEGVLYGNLMVYVPDGICEEPYDVIHPPHLFRSQAIHLFPIATAGLCQLVHTMAGLPEVLLRARVRHTVQARAIPAPLAHRPAVAHDHDVRHNVCTYRVLPCHKTKPKTKWSCMWNTLPNLTGSCARGAKRLGGFGLVREALPIVTM